ncbi:MAG: bifunctional oligoribonuclease/PAP phosphatase NrnA [Candidatus Aminicenantes bacterium]|nr:MAG: bifunctional oligoribonuclease/PAP phosphatase NrnA [Candidatus Aminicenantes bacterium]
MKNDPANLICQKILESQRIVVTSHLRPDGDSICTGLALAFIGELLGKEVEIINRDKTPFPLNNIPDIEKIQIGQIPAQGFDLVILLECANVSRSGQENLNNYFKINIDHHHSNDYYADINWVDPEASAVAEMIYTLGEKLNIQFTPQIANHLYCAIVSDTGSFQFSNTNSRSFEVCHELIDHGARSIQIAELLFNNNSPEKIKLLGHVLSTLQMNKKGNIATITMFNEHLDSLHLKEVDTEDIITLARSIKGVQMVLFFKEIEKDTFRVSLRSKGKMNAAYVAENFGGGGHLHAAGFTVTGEYTKLLKEIPETVAQLLKKHPKKIPDKHKDIDSY